MMKSIIMAILFFLPLICSAQKSGYLELRGPDGEIVDKVKRPNFKETIVIKDFYPNQIDYSYRKNVVKLEYNLPPERMKKERRRWIVYYSKNHPSTSENKYIKAGITTSEILIKDLKKGWYTVVAANELGTEITYFNWMDSGKMKKYKTITISPENKYFENEEE